MLTPSDTGRREYTALIRTFNSEQTLPGTLASLNRQTNPPGHYVFVDSGSSDRTLACVPPGSRVHHYVGREFNFSEAINQGLPLVSGEYVLIISSHTELENRQAIEYALDLLHSDPNLGAAYFCADNTGSLQHELVGRDNFTGFNGMWNTCSLIRFSLLKERAFRSDVFSAEDQEWAGWYFSNKGGRIARISGAGWKYGNAKGTSELKMMNEYVSVAYFANRTLMSWENILRFAWWSVKPGKGSRYYSRGYYARLSVRLLACHFWQPRFRSRYF